LVSQSSPAERIDESIGLDLAAISTGPYSLGGVRFLLLHHVRQFVN